MVGETDSRDKRTSRSIAIALIALLMMLGLSIVLLLPQLSELIALHLTPGLGLKDSAIISFFVTIILMIIFAVFSGDGLIGEFQFLLGGFFLFFAMNWLLIAWVF